VPAYEIHYTRHDMDVTCKAIKYAHDSAGALDCLCSGNKKRGYSLKKTGVLVKIVKINELKQSQN